MPDLRGRRGGCGAWDGQSSELGLTQSNFKIGPASLRSGLCRVCGYRIGPEGGAWMSHALDSLRLCLGLELCSGGLDIHGSRSTRYTSFFNPFPTTALGWVTRRFCIRSVRYRHRYRDRYRCRYRSPLPSSRDASSPPSKDARASPPVPSASAGEGGGSGCSLPLPSETRQITVFLTAGLPLTPPGTFPSIVTWPHPLFSFRPHPQQRTS